MNRIMQFTLLTILFAVFFFVGACTTTSEVETAQPKETQTGKDLQRKAATTSAAFEYGDKLPRFGESTLANLVSDAMVWYTEEELKQKADFALINGGAIQAGLPNGVLTNADFYKALPFETEIYLVTVSGNKLYELFDFIASINRGSNAFAQTSKEATYMIEYNTLGKEGSISHVRIRGEEIIPSKEYLIVTTDYLALGGDGYTILSQASTAVNTQSKLQEAVIEYAKNLKQPISPNLFQDARRAEGME